MTKPLADEFQEIGVRVVTVATGIMNTPLNQQIKSEPLSHLTSYCTIAPNRLGEAYEYAHMVHTIMVNPTMNGTTIELAAGFDLSP